MSDLVDPSEVEAIVGIKRQRWTHWGRLVGADQRVYILHSADCRGSGRDLRACPFSLALDRGVKSVGEWRPEGPSLLWVDLQGRLRAALAKPDSPDDFEEAGR